MPQATRRWLEGLAAEDVQRLEALIERDLSAWRRTDLAEVVRP